MFGALGGEPATADELVARTGLAPGAVAVAAAGLVRAGHATRAHGLVWPVITAGFGPAGPRSRK